MEKIVGYAGWFLIAMASIYLGAYIRYIFFNKHKKRLKYFAKDYFYPNYMIGVYIFIAIILVIRYFLGYEIIKE